MKVQGKVWGVTKELFAMNNVEGHYIDVSQGGYCSKHKHETKYNKFIVLEGELKVTVWKSGTIDCVILEIGEELVVAPGDYHMFEAVTPVKALEFYWTELKADDIVRENHGGMR